MSKAVMISIHPKWCELIASGKKTIEVRKTRPKLDTPFKCYIYKTMTGYVSRSKENDILVPVTYGKVIGEFVCDNITRIAKTGYMGSGEIPTYKLGPNLACSCLTYDELEEYAKGRPVYLWHISGLVIYDKPKELSDFAYAVICPYNSKNGCGYKLHCFRAGEQGKGAHGRCGEYLSRPPQSWMYVEELI